MENQTYERIPVNAAILSTVKPDVNKNSRRIKIFIPICLILLFLICLILSIYFLSENEKKSKDEKYTQIVNNLKKQTKVSIAISKVNSISQITPSFSTPSVTFSNSPVDYSSEVIFIDKTENLKLSVQLKQPQYSLHHIGDFIFLINSKEGYEGTIPVTDLGHDTFRLAGTVSTKYKPDMYATLYAPLPTDDYKQMTINGTVNAANGQVTLNISTGTVHYSFIE